MFDSMTRRQWMTAAAGAAVGAAFARVATAAGADKKFREIGPWTLYSFDNGLNGPDVPTVESKAALLKKLGYAGMTDHFNLHRLPEVLDQLDKHGLEFASLYYVPKVEDETDPLLREYIGMLKGRRTRIEIGFLSKQFKPSDPAADTMALDRLKRIADWCGDTGPVISIYPHRGFWTDRVEDGIRLSKKSGGFVGTNFNLIHWKLVTQTRPLEELVADAAPHLRLVTICGVDQQNKNAATSLADGDFDVLEWLRPFKKAGYNGPIGLQCYAVKSPTSEAHLAKSMAKWREMKKQLS